LLVSSLLRQCGLSRASESLCRDETKKCTLTITYRLTVARVRWKTSVTNVLCYSYKLKTFSAVFFLIDFFYIYICYRKFNAKFNKLIKTVGHLLLGFFSKKDVEHTHLCQQYLDIFIFSLIKSLSCNKTLEMLGL